MKGLEPSCRKAHAPKACVSTIPPHPRIKNYTANQFFYLTISFQYLLN